MTMKNPKNTKLKINAATKICTFRFDMFRRSSLGIWILKMFPKNISAILWEREMWFKSF